MKLNTSGITLASVALVAVVGGVAGGALVGTGGSPEQSNPLEVELRSTTNGGELAEPSPAPSPSAITVPVLEPVAEAPASEPAPAPETEPSGTTVDPVAEKTPQPKAADRAEAPEPSPAPVTTPVATPVPTPEPECKDGDTQQFTDNRTQREPGWTPGTRVCVDGEWVRTAEPKPPVASGPVTAPAPPSQ